MHQNHPEAKSVIEVMWPSALVIGGVCALVAGLVGYVVGWLQGSGLDGQTARVVPRWRAPPGPISIRDRLSVWTTPIGEVMYFHLLIDRGLVDLIWLIEGHAALRLGHRLPQRRDPPPNQKISQRIRQFAKLAMVEFTDTEARATIERLVEDIKAINRFRNTLAHSRWAGFTNEQLNLIDLTLPGANKLVQITREEMDARGRKAFELSHDRLGNFQLWVTKQNAEVAKHQK